MVNLQIKIGCVGMNRLLIAIALLATIAIIIPVHGETDWKGDPKWGAESHDDNKPTEKQFWKVAESKKLHSLAKCIDWMQCKNNDVDFDKFTETKAWTNATEDQKICIVESEDLGNTLVDYELLDCYKNPNYYNER